MSLTMREPEEETDEEWARIADIMSEFEAQYMSSHNTISNLPAIQQNTAPHALASTPLQPNQPLPSAPPPAQSIPQPIPPVASSPVPVDPPTDPAVVTNLQTQLDAEREQRLGESANLRNRIQTLQNQIQTLRQSAANRPPDTDHLRLTRELATARRDREDLTARLAFTRAELAAAKDRERRHLAAATAMPSSSIPGFSQEHAPEKALVPPMTQPGEVVEATQRIIPSHTPTRGVKRRRRRPPLPIPPGQILSQQTGHGKVVEQRQRTDDMNIGSPSGEQVEDQKDDDPDWHKRMAAPVNTICGFGVRLSDRTRENDILRQQLFRECTGWDALTKVLRPGTLAAIAGGKQGAWDILLSDSARFQRADGAIGMAARKVVGCVLREGNEDLTGSGRMRMIIEECIHALKKWPEDEDIHGSLGAVVGRMEDSREGVECVIRILQAAMVERVDRVVIGAAEMILEGKEATQEECGRAIKGLMMVGGDGKGGEDVMAVAVGLMGVYAAGVRNVRSIIGRVAGQGNEVGLGILGGCGGDGEIETTGLIGVIGSESEKKKKKEEMKGWKECLKEYKNVIKGDYV